MTPDERNLLTTFLQDLSQTRGGLKDAEASDMIGRTIQANPDAAYMLVQHAIIADQALHAAQARVTDLENQLRANGAGQGGPSSFLGAGQSGQSAPWGASSGGYAQPGYGEQRGYGQPGGYAPPPEPPRQGGLLGGLLGGGRPAQPGGFGSFLRTAGTTAAGVAGGEFLFHGLSNMFGGGGYGGGFGGPVENVTVNEYGGGDGGGFGDNGFDGGGFDNGGGDDSGNF